MLQFVYTLIDPRTGVVAYIGITDNPNRRFQAHLDDTKTNGEKRAWIEQLQSEHLEPRMEIIEIVETREEVLEREKYWIQHYTSLGIAITNMVYSKPKTLFQSQAPEGYYTATEAAEKLNAGSLGLPQGKMFRDILPERRRVRKMLDMTYSVLINHVRAGRIRSIIPPGKRQAVYNKEDVDQLSQPEKNYYTAKEAQEILNMTYSALRNQVNIGNIHSFVPPGRRQAVYLKEDVDQLSREIEAFWEGKDTTIS